MKNDTIFEKRGYPLPLGVTVLDEGINFALFSRHAEEVTLVIAFENDQGEEKEFRLDPSIHKTGDIWHILLEENRKDLLYGYRVKGAAEQGSWFDENRVLIDPYSHQLVARKWGEMAVYGDKPACKIVQHDFDWQGDRPLKTPLANTIIYEMHVRGFTNHRQSKVQAKGTYKGVVEKIPYLKELGVTAVELMPINEYDENDNVFHHPVNGELLKNYWGYNPISYFALKSGYASEPDNHINEFKEMVKALHSEGIEVILDMVYNHTGEGGYQGMTVSFRGIDNSVYYLLGKHDHNYLNYSGCGNTMNCNHPVVRELIRESLRFWVIEMHVDGFRFDLASILGRDQDGNVLSNPPMIEIIAEDPVLRDTKIIAEAWDAAGLYQVGTFSTDERWAEWNGKFRDEVRAFFAGYDNSVTGLATRIAGSSDLYQTSSRGPLSSINFLTSHDGFTLYDLVSYENKYNEENGEQNRDGDNHNISWNSGAEGVTTNEDILELRYRRVKSMAAVLLLSQGVPMITAGDEIGRTQGGNNNAWCQDNEISWLDWTLVQKNEDLLRFFKGCIRLRRSHPVFRREEFFSHTEGSNFGSQGAEITWQGREIGKQDWSAKCHHLAFLLHGEKSGDDDFFVMMNGDRSESVSFEIPEVPRDKMVTVWKKIVDTSNSTPDDLLSLTEARVVLVRTEVKVPPQAVVVLQSQRV